MFFKNMYIVILLHSACALSTSRSFLMPRMITTDPTFELTLSNYAIYHGANKYCSFFSCFVSPLHQKSKNGQHIARYFFPHESSAIIVDQEGLGNVVSNWLGLTAPDGMYHGQLSMKPERTVNGGYVNLFFNFKRYVNGLWASITTSLINVDHDLRLCELPSQEALNGSVSTIVSALNNPAWQYGKFSPCSLKKTGIDDVQLKLGYNLFYLDENHLGVYLVGTIPTGNHPRAHYIFEPIVGSKHGSIGFGINADLPVYYSSSSEIVFMVDLKYRYLFASKQWRSFDLCANGDWSRYLLFTTQANTFLSQPGINFVTQQLLIKPRTTFDLWLAMHFNRAHCNIEVGYDLWLRVHEKVGTRCPLPDGISIFDIAGAAMGNPISASRATINETVSGSHQAPSDVIFSPLTRDDLNSISATNPRVLTHKIFAGLAYDGCICNMKYTIGGATSYEFARTIGALEQVAVWFNVGLQY